MEFFFTRSKLIKSYFLNKLKLYNIMSTIRIELISAAINRALTSIDYNIHNDIHKQNEFVIQTILADNSLTNDEKTEAIRLNNKDYDRDKILYNSGTRR